MKKALFLFALLMSLSLPAYAYKTAQPSIEIDLSVLEPAPESVTAAPLPAPLPPSEGKPTHLKKGRVLKPTPAPEPEIIQPEVVAEEEFEEEPLPPPQVEKPKRLLKPFFATAPLPPENLPPQKAEVPLKTPPKPVFPKRPLVKTPPPLKKPIIAAPKVKDIPPSILPKQKPEIKVKEEIASAPIAPVETEVEMISVPLIPKTETETPPPAPLPEEEITEEEITKEEESAHPVARNIALTLSFSLAQGDLSPEHQAQLDAFLPKLTENEVARLQIRAYATGEDGSPSNARRMSLSRALMVRSYLMDKEVKPVRLDVRALGSETTTTPLDRVDLVFVE